jgi:hypothetical protein
MVVHPLTRAVTLAVLVAVVGIGIVYIRFDSGGYDYWQHLAAFRFISQNVVDPPPLFFSEPYEVHLYTPYHVFWGSVMAATGFGIWMIAALAAGGNLLLFFVGCRQVARFLVGDSRLNMAVCAALLFFWGRSIWWSGVYSFEQVALQAVYPSFFALSASMVIIAYYF